MDCKKFPNEPVPLLKGKSLVRYTHTNKIDAVVNLCSHSGSAKKVENEAGISRMNCTPFVRQYGILDNKWGDLLCQKENQTRDILQHLRKW